MTETLPHWALLPDGLRQLLLTLARLKVGQVARQRAAGRQGRGRISDQSVCSSRRASAFYIAAVVSSGNRLFRIHPGKTAGGVALPAGGAF